MIAELAPARASDLAGLLRHHYLPDGRLAGGIFATEIQSPDGSRRADALWCPWSSIGGSGLVGHEIKVSRADLIVELQDPTKADPWARFCREWWLVVVHPSLVDGLQIPTSWGIMAPPSGRRRRSMTIVRPAPRLKPIDTGRAWQRIAAWSEFRSTDRIREAEMEAHLATSKAERAERELLDRRLAEQGRVDGRAAKVGQILAALDERRWYGLLDDEAVEAIVAAVVNLDETTRLARRTRDEIRYLVAEARRVAAPMADVAKSLAALAGPDRLEA